jgi:serine/threonine protein kinase
MTSSDLRPRYLITSENENIGSGSFGTVKAAYPTNELDRSTAQAPCVAVKLIPLSLSEGLPSDAFREIKYSNILSTTTINPLTKELVRTESFTGVPKIIDAFVDKKSNNIVIVQELCSRLNLSSLIEWFGHVDMTRAFFAWLNQSLFVLATAEETGILNRDIKPHHLLINRNGSLAIIDWSLSTKHADNKYLTPYTFTFTVRPPEVFFYQQVAMDETKQSEPDDWCKINSLSGPEMPHPYSHEADMFSLGMSLITCLLGSEPVKY